MLILPGEQYLTDYTIINVAGVTPFNSHWVNVVAPDYALSTIYQDGVLIPPASFIQIGTTNYFGTQISVTQDSHTFNSIFPFGISVYGWRTVDSYGYPGGGSMSPVVTVDSVFLSPDTLYGELNVTNLCLTAHVQNSLSNPVEGVLVNFYISGINPLVGNAYTNAAGDGQYCYTQTGTSPGIDLVYAEVFGIVSDTSVIYWNYQCNDPVEGGTIGDSQSGCGELLPTPLLNSILPSGETGTLEFKWQQSLVGSTSGFTDIAGTNSPDYNPGMLTQTTWFRRLARVTCINDWNTAALSNVVGLTVIQPLPVSVTIVTSDTSICEGTTVTFTATPVNGGISPSYQWKVNANNAGMDNAVFSYLPENGDDVTCILTSSEPCSTNNPSMSNEITMNVAELPSVIFTPCFDTVTMTGAKPIKLKGGIPYGGYYTGAGVSGGYYDPALAVPGIHVITYTYTNIFSCAASAYSRIRQLDSPLFTCGNDLIDPRDNKGYPTIRIGNQCWMSANLDYGIQISEFSHQRDNCVPEKYKPPGGSQQPAVYQWDELMLYDDTPGIQGLCPPGWHIPTEVEWNLLFVNWTNNAFAGAPLRYSGYSGFNAFLPGVLHHNIQWDFLDIATFFWSSTAYGSYKAWSHGINGYDPSVSLYPSLRSNAFSVRCVRD